MNIFFSFVAGLIFGLGLIVSGMANPSNVIGFLNLAGAWNPSLAFAMGGAVAVGLAVFAIAKRLTISFIGLPIRLPTARHIDARLILGNTLFGIGWGLAGICPGPALVLLGTGAAQGFVFAVAMLCGMSAFELLDARRASRAKASAVRSV